MDFNISILYFNNCAPNDLPWYWGCMISQLIFPLALSISGDLGYQHIEAFDNKDEVIPKRLYALQARANLEYQFTRKFGIFATGGYGLTRFYNKSSNYDKGAIIEAGIVLF